MTTAEVEGLRWKVYNALVQQPRRVRRHAQIESLTTQQVHDQCISAAFLAAQEGLSIEQAIQQLFNGVESVAYDKQRRRSYRRDGASVEEYCWDAWRQPPAGTRQKRQTRTAFDVVWNREVTDDATREMEHQRVCEVIEKRLSSRDAKLVFDHYHDGVSQVQLARVYGMTEDAVNTALHRARARVRSVLAHKVGVQQPATRSAA